MARYLIGNKENFEGNLYRFIYDTKYKHFHTVLVQEGTRWVFVKNVPDHFYIYFPGFAARLRETDELPTWAR